MAFSGNRVPGIFCPDESVEQFASLYANNNNDRNIIMSTVLDPYNIRSRTQQAHYHPQEFQQNLPPRYSANSSGPVAEQRFNLHARYGPQDLQRPGSSRHSGYGDHHSAPPIYDNHKATYPGRSIHRRQTQQRSPEVKNPPSQYQYAHAPQFSYPWL